VLVVGHCRSPGSRDVLDVAGDLAGRLGAVVQVVHAISLDDYPVDPDADDWEAQATRVLQDQRAEVEAALNGVVPGWSYHAARGDPVDLLATVAEEHDALMIVVGARGHGAGAALARLLNRSVSRAVIGRQRRPVLVVPHP
jgi:nucleotide-binding universal stress UspA family protein